MSFKKWNSSMKKMTTKRRQQIVQEEDAFQRDLLHFPGNLKPVEIFHFGTTILQQSCLKKM